MPIEFHEPRRRLMPKARYGVTNEPSDDRGLTGRGVRRLWIADGADDGASVHAAIRVSRPLRRPIVVEASRTKAR